MKNTAIILILTTLALLALGCGSGKSESNEAKPTTAANTAAANTGPLNVQPANVQSMNATRRDRDGDADDQPHGNVANTNSNRRVDADDVRTKAGNVNVKANDRDDPKKKGDADDRGRRDGDEDDH